MTSLSIRDDRSGQSWRVWPEPDSLPTGAVTETGSFIFELCDCEDAAKAELFIDDIRLEALRADNQRSSRWRWSPGFHAGTVDAQLHLPHRGVQYFEFITDPDLGKLTRTSFDTMVREILEDTFALFALSGFRKGVARGVGGRAPALARLEFLRSRVAEIESTVQAIARKPRRFLAAEVAAIPYYRTVRATGPEILRSFRSGRALKETQLPGRLPTPLRGYLPMYIKQRRRRSSLDLPEHRQIKACLGSWSAWLSATAELITGEPSNDNRELGEIKNAWSMRCRRLSRRLQKAGELPPFAEASETAPSLTLSPVFRNDPAYRGFFRLWQDMNLGIAAVFGDFLKMPLKRTFDLYELWCFLRLVRAAINEFGPEGVDFGELFIEGKAGAVTVAAGAVTVNVGSGWKLCFQKQYREYWLDPGRKGSFSRTMTPDMVFSHNGQRAGERLIVLDAKYRINEGLNDALSSIHTYRDAIVRASDTGAVEGIVGAAYLLAPFLPQISESSGYAETSMPGRLFHPEYRQAFRFGAITLQPGMKEDQMQEALRSIVSDATS